MHAFLLAFALLAGCEATPAAVNPSDLGQQGLSFWPPEAGRGTQFDARIESGTSIFTFEGTDLTLGDGVTVNSLTVLDGWTAVASLDVHPEAPLGAQDANISTEEQSFTIGNALTIVDDSFTLSPNRARIGESVQVEFIGQNTGWTGGATWANFGDGVDVTAVEVYTENYMVATVQVQDDASPGLRDVAVDTGSEFATLFGGFQVDRVALSASFEPTSVAQGDVVSFTIQGEGTHFAEGESELSFWQNGDEKGDITVDSLTVLDTENMYGTMTVSNAAELGFRDVIITTENEGVFLGDAFEVTAGELDLDAVGISLAFYVLRYIDNDTGRIDEYVVGFAAFPLPLDPPCPPNPESACDDGIDDDNDGFTDCYDTDCGNAPNCNCCYYPDCTDPEECACLQLAPFDDNMECPSWEPQGGTADCPSSPTVGAGEHVWFESDCNIVTLDRTVDSSSGMIYYTSDLTLVDYCFDQVYDLHTEGEEGGIPEEILQDVQPTVPADYELLVPAWWGNFTQSREEQMPYTWTPAQTYPTAIFVTTVSGQLVVPDGSPGRVSTFPWDDGEHAFTPDQLQTLKAGPAQFMAYSYIEGNEFGFSWSTIQDNKSASYVAYVGSLVLE